jgi:aspartyl-tRNA(Asn)/glutamyl-tRNA(Gln) amidotransferase subunit C
MEVEQIRWVAHLARLGIPDDELPRFREELTRILNFVDQMRAVDTTQIEPLAHPLDLPARLRADEVTEEPDRAANQATAAEHRDGYYLVPQVIE